MNYAVIKLSGSQYKVSLGDKIEAKGFQSEKGKIITLDQVLLSCEDGKLKVGKPIIKDAKVEAEVIEQKLGEKIVVAKFKAKTGYRRRIGFRAKQTVLQIKSIAA